MHTNFLRETTKDRMCSSLLRHNLFILATRTCGNWLKSWIVVEMQCNQLYYFFWVLVFRNFFAIIFHISFNVWLTSYTHTFSIWMSNHSLVLSNLSTYDEFEYASKTEVGNTRCWSLEWVRGFGRLKIQLKNREFHVITRTYVSPVSIRCFIYLLPVDFIYIYNYSKILHVILSHTLNTRYLLILSITTNPLSIHPYSTSKQLASKILLRKLQSITFLYLCYIFLFVDTKMFNSVDIIRFFTVDILIFFFDFLVFMFFTLFVLASRRKNGQTIIF